MNKLNMSHEELNRELTTYNGDYTLAISMLMQSADEIDVALMALGGSGQPIVHTLLTAIAQRMRFVATLADQKESEVANG